MANWFDENPYEAENPTPSQEWQKPGDYNPPPANGGGGPTSPLQSQAADAIRKWYRDYLGREASDMEVSSHLGNPGGLGAVEQLIKASPEAKARQQAPAPNTSGWNAGGYTNPAYTAPTPSGSAPAGWDQAKWADPNKQSPKYAVGRILSQYQPNDDGFAKAVADIQKAYPGTTSNGKDKVTIPGVGTIDIRTGASQGGTGWAWQDTADPGYGNNGNPDATTNAGGGGGTDASGSFGSLNTPFGEKFNYSAWGGTTPFTAPADSEMPDFVPTDIPPLERYQNPAGAFRFGKYGGTAQTPQTLAGVAQVGGQTGGINPGGMYSGGATTSPIGTQPGDPGYTGGKPPGTPIDPNQPSTGPVGVPGGKPFTSSPIDPNQPSTGPVGAPGKPFPETPINPNQPSTGPVNVTGKPFQETPIDPNQAGTNQGVSGGAMVPDGQGGWTSYVQPGQQSGGMTAVDAQGNPVAGPGAGYAYQQPGQGYIDPKEIAPDAYKYQDFTGPTEADLYEDPSYKVRRDEGLRAVEASAAARGNLLTGGTLKGLTQYGQEQASKEFGNVYNRKFNTWSGNAGKALNEYNAAANAQNTLYNQALGTYNVNAGQYDTAWNANKSVSDTTYDRQIGTYGVNAANRANKYQNAYNLWNANTGNKKDDWTTNYNKALNEYKMRYDIWNTQNSNQFDRLYKLSTLGQSSW